MKANEFVKNYGLNRAIEILRVAPEGAASFDFINFKYSDGTRLVGKKHVSLDHLKRLVESHFLVREHGTLDRAKEYADSKYTAPEVADRLKQAIANAEACQ